MKLLSNSDRFPEQIAKRVYVCGSLRPEVVAHVDRKLHHLLLNLDYPVVFLRPDGTDLNLIMDTVREDVAAIESCHELWQIGDLGRDSSWELGYSAALGKPIVIWVDDTNRKKIESDAMFRIGLERGLVRIRELDA